jgi:hypothetical protein
MPGSWRRSRLALLVVHAHRVQPVHQLRQGFNALLEEIFQRRDKVHLPVFRLAAAGLPDQVLVIAWLMNGTVTAFCRRRKLAAFRQRRVVVRVRSCHVLLDKGNLDLVSYTRTG